MSPLKAQFSPITVLRASVASTTFLGILFVWQIVTARAAKQAGTAEDMRVAAQLNADAGLAAHPTPVLVELFTSEGCSSCPPADALLARLDHDQPIQGADIIVLSEHVDYWDHLGWKDRFSSPDVTQRQRDYQDYFHLSDVYTPQTVVHGSMQFNGTDGQGIDHAIEKAALDKAVLLRVTDVTVHEQEVRFTLLPGPPMPEYVNVYAALVDPEDTTEVRAGENNGRTLHHAGVVRWLGRVGSSWHMKDLGRHPFMFSAWNPSMPPAALTGNRTRVPIADGMRLVVFVQVKHIGPVLGMVSCTLLPTTSTSAAVPQTTLRSDRCPAPSI
jgi:hypothetical protein